MKQIEVTRDALGKTKAVESQRNYTIKPIRPNPPLPGPQIRAGNGDGIRSVPNAVRNALVSEVKTILANGGKPSLSMPLTTKGLIMPVDRLMVKWESVRRHGGPYFATCDACGVLLRNLGQAGELHEWAAPRARTLKGGAARDASYTAPLTALLCNQCHHRLHSMSGSDDDRNHFAQVNYQLYGYDAVKRAYDHLQALLALKGLQLPYKLPEASGDAD